MCQKADSTETAAPTTTSPTCGTCQLKQLGQCPREARTEAIPLALTTISTKNTAPALPTDETHSDAPSAPDA